MNTVNQRQHTAATVLYSPGELCKDQRAYSPPTSNYLSRNLRTADRAKCLKWHRRLGCPPERSNSVPCSNGGVSSAVSHNSWTLTLTVWNCRVTMTAPCLLWQGMSGEFTRLIGGWLISVSTVTAFGHISHNNQRAPDWFPSWFNKLYSWIMHEVYRRSEYSIPTPW